MKKAIKVFSIYLLVLLLCSLLFAWLNINSDKLDVQLAVLGGIQPILIPTIIGGLIALKLTVPPKVFKTFILVYAGLWLLRIILLNIADRIGAVQLFNKTYRFDIIIRSYYQTISRLETPLPFIIFWFIYYFYSILQNKEVKSSNE
jgi:hypothetical protein